MPLSVVVSPDAKAHVAFSKAFDILEAAPARLMEGDVVKRLTIWGHQAIVDQFLTHGASMWEPLSPYTLRRRRYEKVRGWIHEKSEFAWRAQPLIRTGNLLFSLTNPVSSQNVTTALRHGCNLSVTFGSRNLLARIHHRGAFRFGAERAIGPTRWIRGRSFKDVRVSTYIIPARSMSPSSYVLSTFAQDVERNVLLPIIDEAIRG